jgi:hypothetical protein
MKSTFLRRLGFYLGGFAIGLVILSFFLSGKRTSCSYFPDARVKKNITSKTIIFSDDFKQQLLKKSYDSAAIINVLTNGDVNFSESNVELDSCKIYALEGYINNKEVQIKVENCETEAKLQSITEID